MINGYDVINTERVMVGRFTVVLDTVKRNNEELPYSFVEVKNSVAILAKKEERFVFINQYRHTIKDYSLEIPGGAIDVGETPLAAAERELLEETGYSIKTITPIGSFYPTIGIFCEKCYLFLAECGSKEDTALDPLEDIEIKMMNEAEIEDAISNGLLMHSMALVAWQKYKVERDANRGNRAKL